MVTTQRELDAATALVVAGRDDVNHGRPASASRHYCQALAELPDDTGAPTRRLRARAHLGLALATVEMTGDVDAGMAHLADAEAILPDAAADLRAALLGQRGILLVRAGRLEAALATFESAESILDRTAPSHRASMVLNRGLLRLELGNPVSAQVDFERARTEAAAAGQPRTAYKARHNLAYAAFVEGDLPRAIDGMARAAVHDDGSIEPPDPITMMDRGRVLLEAGLVDDADRLLVRAQDEFERQHRGRDLGEVALVRADAAVITGDLDKASTLASTAITNFTVAGNDRWRRRAELVDLVVARRRLSDPVQPSGRSATGPVAGLYANARQLAAASGGDPDVAVAASLLAVELACELGQVDRAVRHMDQAVLPEPCPLRLRLSWHTARATVLRARGGDGLHEEFVAGVAALDAAQAQFGSRDLRAAVALHGRALVDLGVSAALERGDPEVLHQAVDLAHSTSARLAPVQANLDDDDRRLLAELRALEERRWREPDASEARRHTRAARASELRTRLRRRSWRHSGAGAPRVGGVVTRQQWQDALADCGATGVSFFALGGHLHAMRTDRNGSETIDLGPSGPVMDLVERLRADLRVLQLSTLAPSMRKVVQHAVDDVVSELDAAVLAPLGSTSRSLVVVPHGGLALVPWCLVPSRRGRPTMSTASATAWVLARASAVDTADPPVVRALAGPDLPRAVDEVAAVMARWNESAAGGLASASELHEALRTADIVHVAAHGTHRGESPLFSSVRLADGPVFAHELVQRVRAGLVVLSACDVGQQAIRAGDEPLGFAAALLDAGVRVVVGSVAPIRDDVAAQVGAGVHDRLMAGDPPAVAVAHVTAAAWDSGQVVPLVVLGDGW